LEPSPNDGKVEALERCVLDLVPLLADWKNSFAGVNCLPPELLARVAWFLPSRDIYAGLRVCRYWYNVMMSPELWSDIDLDWIDRVPVFLRRSKEAPVNMKITRRPKEIHRSTLRTCSSRIHSLDISSQAVGHQLLTHFPNTPAPLMRDLRVTRDYYSPRYLQLPSTLFTGNLPSLRVLVLVNISSDFTHLTLPNLTSFLLLDVTDPNANLTLSNLLNFLERSPLLQTAFFGYHSRYDDAVAPERIVTLHHLEHIRIKGEPLTPIDASRGLLAHLSLPSVEKLKLSVKIPGPDTDIVARAIPPHRDPIHCTESLGRILFQHKSDSQCTVTFFGMHGSFCIRANWERDYGDFAARAVYSFGSLDVSGVSTLVTNYRGPDRHFTRALRSLENLRSLVVWCHGDAAVLLYCLCQEGTSPLLRTLNMKIWHGSGVRVDDLLEVVRVRKLRGQTLEELSLELSSPDTLVGDVSLLQEHVGSLDYTVDAGMVYMN
jgi:hypothetical protein